MVAIADRILGEDLRPEMVKLAEALRAAAAQPVAGEKGARLGQLVNDPDPGVRLVSRPGGHRLSPSAHVAGCETAIPAAGPRQSDKVLAFPDNPFSVRNNEPRKPRTKTDEPRHNAVFAEAGAKPTEILLDGLGRCSIWQPA